MKCVQHGKELITICTWCGKQMCKLCIKKTDGKKAYCGPCVAQIGDMLQKKQIETINKENELEKKNKQNEYFNFSSIKRS